MKLKACPFCASRDVAIWETDSGIAGLRGEYYVMCGACFAESGKYDTRAEAKAAWDRRALCACKR